MKLDWIEGHDVAEILALVVVVALQNARRIVDLPAIEADIFFSLSLSFVSKPYNLCKTPIADTVTDTELNFHSCFGLG